MKNTKMEVCSDCMFIAIYDDTSGLDHYLPEDKASARHGHILGEIAKLDGYLVQGDDYLIRGDVWSNPLSTPCELCGSTLAGVRHVLTLSK